MGTNSADMMRLRLLVQRRSKSCVSSVSPSQSEIVRMARDGVNDAPSLKAVDISIVLGSGSDIAIEVADMVLLESFSAVVEAVQYGRDCVQ